MSVDYDILDKKGEVLSKRRSQACFSEFPYNRQAWFTDIGAILYKVEPRKIKTNDALLYLAHLKTIGFPITQTPEQVLENGFLLDFNNCVFNKQIRAPAIGAALTVVRYLEEFPRIIGRFLNLLDIDPTLDLWLAFRLAHVFAVAGTRIHNDYFGMGHCLFTYPYNGGHPTKTWPQVIESLEKSRPWKQSFASWDINLTYGKYDDFLDKKKMKIPCNIITADTLKDAIAWLN